MDSGIIGYCINGVLAQRTGDRGQKAEDSLKMEYWSVGVMGWRNHGEIRICYVVPRLQNAIQT